MLSGYIDCSVVPLLWAGGTTLMAGRSGLQSLLLSHTKPVTAQVSHLVENRRTCWELWMLLQEAETTVTALQGPCFWNGGKTFEKWGHITTCFVFSPVNPYASDISSCITGSQKTVPRHWCRFKRILLSSFRL